MSRLEGVDVDRVGPAEKRVFAEQVERWGTPLDPYLLYARRPTVMHAVVGMWDGLARSGLLEGALTTLVNRRVAALNGCVF